VVSLWASGRLSIRLIADGMVSFAFLPLFQVASFAIVYRRTTRAIPFAQAVDRFFAGSPWLLWLTAFAALRCVLTPTLASAPPILLWRTVQATIVCVIVWSARLDLRFFRDVLSAPGRHTGDVIMQRSIGWIASIVYFFGIALWAELAGRIY
jgi:hypothetical protein